MFTRGGWDCPVCGLEADPHHHVCPSFFGGRGRSLPVEVKEFEEAINAEAARLADAAAPTPRQLTRAWIDVLLDLGVSYA